MKDHPSDGVALENKRNAIYARQSIDKADSISIESQIEYCRYETRGEPYEVFCDKGYSGKNTDRPQFLKMLSAIRSNRIKRVICYKLDRCSRSILDFTKLMDEFSQYGVEFISCTEKFDTSTPLGRAMLSICIVFAQLERETIQQRIFDTYHSRIKRGFYMGGRIPFAFRLEPYIIDGKKTARYAVVEKEAVLLLQMYDLYMDPNVSQADVARFLNARGSLNPRQQDGLWQRTHIARLLKNPIYVKSDAAVYSHFARNNVHIENDYQDFIGNNGCYLYQKGGEKHLVLAPHEGIVTSDIWLKCANKTNKSRE